VNIALGSILPVTLSPPENRSPLSREISARKSSTPLVHVPASAFSPDYYPAPPEQRYHPTIDFHVFCFQTFTNPFFRNSPVFTSIQNPRGWRALPFVFPQITVPRHKSRTSNPRPFINLRALLSLFCPLATSPSFVFNSLHALFQNTGVGWVSAGFLGGCRGMASAGFLGGHRGWGVPRRLRRQQQPNTAPPLLPDSLCEPRASVAQSSLKPALGGTNARPPR
jgi:hypothetical protein